MREYLLIGEVAALLGVSPKTIRHYHAVGLLENATRTASGYRRYDAAAITRMLAIRRLRALGLSLRQIQVVLDAPDAGQSLRAVLIALAADLDTAIATLQARRQHIADLLAEQPRDLTAQPSTPSPILSRVRAQVAALGITISDALWDQDERLFGLIEDLHWPGNPLAGLVAAENALLSDTARYQELLVLSERLVALADLAVDDPQVAALAAEIRATPAIREMIDTMDAHDAGDLAAPFAQTFEALLVGALTPAQQRCFALIQTGEKER